MAHRIIKTSIESLEKQSNRLNDRESEWWPFKHLKPGEHQRLSLTGTLLFAVLYSVPAGLLAAVISSVLGEPLPAAHLLPFLAVMVMAIFLNLYLSVTLSWNRRAARVRQVAERRNWRR